MNFFISKIAQQLNISEKQVHSTLSLFEEGCTIPFIARYRKEKTGGLDEVQISSIKELFEKLLALENRRNTILKSIEEQGKLTDDLKNKILIAETLNELEDLYLPYKPKKRTRATIAREKGLEPLALQILHQEIFNIEEVASKYIDVEKELHTIDDVLQGARDIIAEVINENAEIRSDLRKAFEEEAVLTSRVIKSKEESGIKYKDYYNWSEPLMKCPSHRMLAMRRGEKEDVLYLDISIDEELAYSIIRKYLIKNKNHPTNEQLELALQDAYKRLLHPSLETEFRILTKEKADVEAIKVFANNLRELLLQSPLGTKRVLAIDPGFRTGCKVVVLDEQGNLLDDDVIYPHEPQREIVKSQHTILALAAKYNIEAIAIGNGTASRETEQFIRSIEQLPKSIPVIVVNEAGASVYSASEVAREEFPDKDVTVRGAVSIGRRLQDPLAELVKIDPKSIGVGQYQHDVDQTLLKEKLDEVVMSCVNAVGVELNTASKQLLSYVSGIGPSLAQNIVEYRKQNGPFRSRKDLLKVPRFGEKAFQQSSGFLRIRDGMHPLDKSAVHPESYHIVEKMANDLNCTIEDLLAKPELRKKIQLEKYITEDVGLPTLQDILNELEKPGRDPRKEFEIFQFDERVHTIEDLKIGMKLPGIVTNVTNFGAFVDVGVHQDGLVHISHLSDEFVSDPNNVIKVGQKVQVTVIDVDISRRRIALSLKSNPFADTPKSRINTKKSTSNTTVEVNDDNALDLLLSKFGKK
ncbi:MAG: RNA-binding transcriptional accessory protein [Bacteroidia bacterium]|nr:MAG: RNA-binding transcriptional accessory protein [Bacteroidia bacterium]